MTVILGIDPGITGAIARISPPRSGLGYRRVLCSECEGLRVVGVELGGEG